MKIVVNDGTGVIGSKLVAKLREHGHDALPAAPESGVNTLTGAGLTTALQDAAVVVDVANSPIDEEGAVLEFFETSTRNLLDAEAAAGTGHHVAVSIVGTDRLDSYHYRAKLSQEKLIADSSIPYSIVRSTQFFEFIPRRRPTRRAHPCPRRGCRAWRHPLRRLVRPALQRAPFTTRLNTYLRSRTR